MYVCVCTCVRTCVCDVCVHVLMCLCVHVVCACMLSCVHAHVRGVTHSYVCGVCVHILVYSQRCVYVHIVVCVHASGGLRLLSSVFPHCAPLYVLKQGLSQSLPPLHHLGMQTPVLILAQQVLCPQSISPDPEKFYLCF